jgi:flagellar hook protein FlgE
MGFQSGLSGLNSATKNLDIIGNNIANAQTVGMKASRAEFSALISSALGTGDSAGNGIGVAISAVTQEFSQGNINITGNNLDVAVNGSGFFQVTLKDGTSAYTRDGQFKLDNAGNIVTNSGASLLGYPLNAESGAKTSVTPIPLKVPSSEPLAAKATSKITAAFNLPGQSVAAASTSPPTPMEKYATAVNAYDSQGVVVPAKLYFVNLGPGVTTSTTSPGVTVNRWAVYTAENKDLGYTDLLADSAANVDAVTTAKATDAANAAANAKNGGTAATFANGQLKLPPFGTNASTNATAILEFDSTGKLLPQTTPIQITLRSLNPTAGDTTSTDAAGVVTTKIPDGTFKVTLDIGLATQYGTAYSVSNLEQNGYTAGDLTGVNISESGQVTTVYSNGQAQVTSQIALCDFRNVQGLTPVGSGNWIETAKSGQPILGAPGEGKFGKLRSGALEESNVDLTAELVNMMTAQRSYQANVQTIKTQDQALQSLVNLR